MYLPVMEESRNKSLILWFLQQNEKRNHACVSFVYIRLKYKVLLKLLKDDIHPTQSLTAYYGDSIECSGNENGFFNECCIISSCDVDTCQQEPKYTDADFKSSSLDSVKYMQFVTEKKVYTAKDGKLKESTQTVWRLFLVLKTPLTHLV